LEGPPDFPPKRPSPVPKAGRYPQRFPRWKGCYQNQSFKPTEESWRQISRNPDFVRFSNDDLVPSCVLSDSAASPDSQVSKTPVKLDSTLMFEMRNPIVMTSRTPSALPGLTQFYGPTGGMDFEDFMRMHRQASANFPHSYFGSNGTPPMAKEKDALGKLFEKYRGKQRQHNSTSKY
jgi:hypothetical protein